MKEDNMDLVNLAKRLWSRRRFILIVTGSFMAFGIFVALVSPKVYTSDCVIVPQTTSKSNAGSLSSLAAMAGINLGDMSGTETLSPKIYPQILKNVDFQKDLMYKKIKFDEWDEPISLYDFYTNKKYTRLTVLDFIKKYTVGLPSTIINAIRGEKDDAKPVSLNIEYSINQMSKKESRCAKILSKVVKLTLNEKNGYLTLSANMPEAFASAQVAEAAYKLLQQYITEFKLQKAQANLDFIRARYEDAKKDFEEKQVEYAEYLDANRAFTSKVAQVKEVQLKSEYTLSETIYTELAKQLLQANVKVKEDTPILTAVKPVSVPYKKTKPKRIQCVFVWSFLGFLVSCGWQIGSDWIKREWPNRL